MLHVAANSNILPSLLKTSATILSQLGEDIVEDINYVEGKEEIKEGTKNAHIRARKCALERYHPGKWKLEQYTKSWNEIEESYSTQGEEAYSKDTYFYFGSRAHVGHIPGDGGGSCGWIKTLLSLVC